MATTDTQNGRKRGRDVPELPTHTFADSGVTVNLHKLSPMTSQRIIEAARRELSREEPEPPMFEQDYGNGKVMEPNRGHPIYVDRLQRWEQKVNKLANERLFKLACLDAIEVTIGSEEQEAIARKKRHLTVVGVDWQPDPNMTDEENDRWFYIEQIACASPEDVQEFYQAIAMRSQPNREAVDRYKAGFQGDIRGEEHLAVRDGGEDTPQ